MTAASPTQPARLPGYDLSEPTADDVRAMLTRVFGPERGTALWADTCRSAGLPATADGADDLRRVAESLAAQGGAVATVARSLDIRLRTHARLAQRATSTAGAAR